MAYLSFEFRSTRLGNVTSRERWAATWWALGVEPSDALFRLRGALLASYSETHRRYHTVQHLDECLSHLDAFRELAVRPQEVELALWYHDVVYEPRRGDNERRSAARALDDAAAFGVPALAAGRLYRLVMATQHLDVPADNDAKLIADIDLAILGADPVRYDQHEEQIRQEYRWMPAPEFRREKRRVLKRLLNRSSIFSTAPFRQGYERKARTHLRRSLDRLRPEFTSVTELRP